MSSGPAPSMVFVDDSSPTLWTVTYDAPVKAGPSLDLSAFTARKANVIRSVLSIDFNGTDTVDLHLSGLTASPGTDGLSYVPPPSSVQSMSGLPATTQVAFPLG